MIFKRLVAFFLDILEVIVFAVAIFLFIYLLVLQPHKIKGSSMEPNYHNGEYLLTDKLTYRFREPKRGEVIVFLAPGANGEEFIKRIIGLPNEDISIKDNSVYINNQKLTESYIPSDIETRPGAFLKQDQEVKIPDGYYFVLGDNRTFSSDSRTWGFVKKEVIKGKAWVIYWPISKAGVIKEVKY